MPRKPSGRVVETFLAVMGGQRRGFGANLLRLGLWLASWPYQLAIWLRNFAFNRGWLKCQRVTVPVVSIGNLTVGGTGKTPCVELVARFYRGLEVQVAILSRGYGSEVGRNDEALLLEENLPDVPHLQGKQRAELARVAVEELESELLILDDGFQHRQLARDLDLVLIDATNPWGFGHLLPRGLLREPRGGLRRANLVILTRCDQVEPASVARLTGEVQRIVPGLPVVQSRHGAVELVNAAQRARPLSDLQGRPVLALCGIGNPAGFRRTLEDLGAAIKEWRTFPDHHPYTRSDVEDLHGWARRYAMDCVVVTTQKDLVKLRLTQLGDRELWALRVQLEITAGQEILDRTLKEVLE